MANKSNAPAGGAGDKLPTAQLMDEVRNLVGALGERTLTSVTDRVSSVADRLTDYAAGGGAAVKGTAEKVTGAAKGGGEKAGLASALGGGLTGAAKGVAKGAAKTAAQTAKKAIGGGTLGQGGSGQDGKVTNIVEEIDVGVPVSVAYNQWTQFSDFPSFMKNVELVEQESDEKLRWRAKIGMSRRSWESTIIEQVPDQRIVWRSTGDKGYVDGAATFHELSPELTKVVLVLEYHPHGLVEKIGNFWRAQGRRARADLRHFQRHVMTQTILHSDEVEGWRGEIRDSQVVEDRESGRRKGQKRSGARKGQRRPEPDQAEEPGPESEADEEPEGEEPEAEQPDAEQPKKRTRSTRPRRGAGEAGNEEKPARSRARRSERPERSGERRLTSSKTGKGSRKGRESSDD